MGKVWILAALAGAVLAGCGREADVPALPDASDTLVAIGKRLGAKLAPADLERLAADESRLVGALTTAERDSLARAYVRFRLDRPARVTVVVPADRPPFWLADQGFRRLEAVIAHPDGPFRLWTRPFEAGTVGLGVPSLDRSRGHYAVFLSGVDGPAPAIPTAPAGWTVVPTEPEVSPYADDARPFGPIPPDLRGATLLQPRRDWRDATTLARGKVWKTRVPSSPTPDQVVVSFGDDPARSLAWTWRTDPSVSTSVVRLKKPDGTSPREATGSVRVIASEGLLNDPIVHRHVVTLDGLEPDTEYRYSVGDGSSRGWSPWYSARTAPASDRDYAFLAMGDPQCGLEEWGQLLASARKRRPDAGFLLIAGDLVDRGNERGNWDHFFLRAAGVFEGLPLMPCVGNHEYLDRGPAIFAGSFRLPGNGPSGVPHGLTYSFEYADSFVAVLDSNPAVYSPRMAGILADWLDRRLAATRARWKFVAFHHPIYPSHPSRAQPQLGEAWLPVFDKHGVDLVLQGHDHAYLRTYPLRGGQSAEGGTTYVVSVSGQKFVPIADRPYTARGFADVATYQSIDISPRRGTLLYRAFDLEGRERDRLELAKPRREVMADRPTLDPEVGRARGR